MNKRRLFALLLVTMLLAASCGSIQDGQAPSSATGEEPVAEEGRETAAQGALLRCLYYDHELFLRGISAPQPYTVGGIPFAGTVPHHLIATDMIAGFLSLAGQHAGAYDRVILISPSHYPELCSSDIVTTYTGWDTPLGRVETDVETVRALLENPFIGAVNDPVAVERDHGAAGLVPYIKHYLPDASVSVCILSNRLSRERLESVQGEIARQFADGRTLLLASLDCSHYQELEQASAYDAETREAIESGDIQRILRFDDRNVDSPQVLSAFLTVAGGEGLEVRFLDNSNSGEKLPHAISNAVYYEGITSYLVYAACRE